MRFIYKELQGYRGDGNKLKKLLNGLPISLRCNGLAVVVAQLATSSGGRDEDRNSNRDLFIVEKLLAKWLTERFGWFTDVLDRQDHVDVKQLVYLCIHLSRLDYIVAQRESILLLEQAKLIAGVFWREK